jgi:hypothetical protein
VDGVGNFAGAGFVEVVDHDLGALAGEAFSDCTANSVAGAGYEDNAIGEFGHNLRICQTRCSNWTNRGGCHFPG